MSRYDMEQAGLIDSVGSQAPLRVSQDAEELGPLSHSDFIPETNSVLVKGGIDHPDRLTYALRLALTIKADMSIHYWTERDFLAQWNRLNDRRQWANRSGSEETIGEYEVNRMNFEEFEECAVMVFDGLGSSAGRYRYGELEAISDTLYKRATDRMCRTILVPAVPALPDFYEYAHFREVVAPQFEIFDL